LLEVAKESLSPAFAWVRIPADGHHTRHYRGLPPRVTGGVDTREFMAPGVLVLARPATGEGSWYLDRYAADGSFAGSTWHPSWVDALEQIQFEYESDLVFEPVPDDATDPRTYAQDRAAQG